MLLKEIVTLQPQGLFGELPLAAPEDFHHRDRRVVIADPSRDTVEELYCPAMSFEELLGAFPRKRMDEDRPEYGRVITNKAGCHIVLTQRLRIAFQSHRTPHEEGIAVGGAKFLPNVDFPQNAFHQAFGSGVFGVLLLKLRKLRL